MRLLKFSSLALLCGIIYSCQNPQPKNAVATTQAPAQAATDNDTRPKDQLYFLNRVKGEHSYEVTSDAMKKDAHAAAFNKYAADSLKAVSGWEMIVTEINDDNFSANSLAKATFDLDNIPVYNLKLVAPIKIDRTVDTISLDNMVEFTYTIPKEPKGAALQKQLAAIKGLSKGDTVIVAGAITHIDGDAKLNFADLYSNILFWEVDLLLTDIKKKSAR